MDIFLRYLLPSIIAASAAIFGVLYSTRRATAKTAEVLRENYMNAAATLREDLMIERKQLIDEIDTLQKRCSSLEKARCPLVEVQEIKDRCDALERTNEEQATELVKLHEQNQKLIHEIKHFGSDLTDE